MQEPDFDNMLRTKKTALAHASGIDHEPLLNALVSMDVSPDTLATFKLVPLVATAWADGDLDPRERDAILQAAFQSGAVAWDSVQYRTLESWLECGVGDRVLESWKQFAASMLRALSKPEQHALRRVLFDEARRIWETADRLLGREGAGSTMKFDVLADLEQALSQIPRHP